MISYERRIMIVYAIVALFGVVQSRAVNISNTWMLPEEGFPVFYRYFRDRISWYEADAVCQFHHANLVTADSSSEYDAIRAYLKELDITEKVWIGLSKPQDKLIYSWTDFHPLSEGHWQESLPAGDTQSLCAVMDPAADFLWRALPCGGPEVAAFICEMPIPSWALGSRGCLLTELPSLTVLYIPEQSALELTSDCGLDGTKRIACKGNADHEEMLKQLTCVIAHEDMDDERTSKTSVVDYFESSTWSDTSDGDGTVTTNWNSNTVNPEHSTSTRHRRETEDTLSPAATQSSFKETSGTNISWQDQHEENVVLTTEDVLLESHVTPTQSTTLNIQKLANEADLKISDERVTEFHKEENGNEKLIHTSTEQLLTTSPAAEISRPPPKPTQELTNPISTLKTETTSEFSKANQQSTEATSTTTGQEGNVEDYPSAINQGQLFSIIENGTMFDIIELNETEQQMLTSKNKVPWPVSTAGTIQSTTTQTSEPSPTKKPVTKKPVQPTKKVPKVQYKKDMVVKHLLTTTQAPTTRMRSVNEMEEQLTKEFDMMPDISDTSVRLNRTFRKELPPAADQEESVEHANLENGSQYGVPRILNFTVVNTVDKDEQVPRDQPQHDDKNITETLVISDKVEPLVVKLPAPDTAVNTSGDTSNYRLVETTVTEMENVVVKKPLVRESLPEVHMETTRKLNPEHNPIDPRLYMLNHHSPLHPNNHNDSTENPKLAKEDFLPKSLIGDKHLTSEPPAPSGTSPHFQTSDGYSELPFSSEEPKKINRHRSLHNNNKARKVYPYFFSRMLG